MTFYSVDRSPEAVAKHGHPILTAWTVKSARDNWVAQDGGHRQAVRAPVAAHLCRTWHQMDLKHAVARGVV